MTKSITRIAATSIATLGALNGALPAQAEVQPPQTVENTCFVDQPPSPTCVAKIGELLTKNGFIDEVPANQNQTYQNIVGIKADGIIGKAFVRHILAEDGLSPTVPEGVFVSKADGVGSVRKGNTQQFFAVTVGRDNLRTVKTKDGTKQVRAHTPTGKFKVARFFKGKRITSEDPRSVNKDPDFIDKNWNMSDIAYSDAVDAQGIDQGIGIHGSPHIKELGDPQIAINKETGEKKFGSNGCIRTSPEVAALNFKRLKAGDPFEIVDDYDYMANSKKILKETDKKENQKTTKNASPTLEPEATPDTTVPPDTILAPQVITPVVTINVNSGVSSEQKISVASGNTVTSVTP